MGKLERLEEDIDQLKTDLINTRKVVGALFRATGIECPEKLEHTCSAPCELCGATVPHVFSSVLSTRTRTRTSAVDYCARCYIGRAI